MRTAELHTHGLDPAVAVLFQARGIAELNGVQQAAIDAGLLRGENLVVSAPTSAGKTLVGELAAARHAAAGGLTVFLCSHKSLASQVHDIFATRYTLEGSPYLKIGILTSDRDTVRGEWSQFDVVVATYEKLYGELIAGGRSLHRLRCVVADEVQTVGDAKRGPTLELLLARLRRTSTPPQILGLSATVPNGALLAEWLDAAHIQWTQRTPPLEHELWVPGARYVFRPDAVEPQRIVSSALVSDVSHVIEELLISGRGPIAVMATTKPFAMQYAERIAAARPTTERFPEELLDEFRGMGRDPNITELVCSWLLRGVGIHHADLTAEQRRVIEDAFLGHHLDVLVATPTLVAGVNLPIRTVVYPRTVRWGGTAEVPISRGEYLNGAGRAGRQGMHDAGTAIILCPSLAAARNLSRYITEGCEPVTSHLGTCTDEYRVLHLLVGSPSASPIDLVEVASGTLWAREHGFVGTPERQAAIEQQIRSTLDDPQWAALWTRAPDGRVGLTRVGRAVAASGLEPTVALEAVEVLHGFRSEREAGLDLPMAKRAFLSRLATGMAMQGFLPFDNQRNQRLAQELSTALDGAVPDGLHWTSVNLVATAQALAAIGDACVPPPLDERMRGEYAERSNVTDRLYRVAMAACAMANADDPAGTEIAVAELSLLAEQLQFQVPERAVPIERLFAEFPVRHVGPKKRAQLVELVGEEIGQLLRVPEGELTKAVGARQVEGVRRAALAYLDGLTREQSARQLAEAKADLKLHALLQDLFRLSGTAFNPVAGAAMQALAWNVLAVDESSPGKKPDLEGAADDGASAVVECKTTEDLAGEISAKEAMDVLKKVPKDFRGHLVTVGRPVFSPAAIEQALHARGRGIHLVTAGALAELLLACRLHGLPIAEAGALLRRYVHIDTGRVRADLAARALHG